MIKQWGICRPTFSTSSVPRRERKTFGLGVKSSKPVFQLRALRLKSLTSFALMLAGAAVAAPVKSPEDELLCRQDDGYRGIWYMNQPSKDEYRYKYSGGFATYPQQHAPIAIYRKEVNKTFFCYGGTTARSKRDKQQLLHIVSFFDHATGEVPRPTILLNKHADDAHDNPTLSIDPRRSPWRGKDRSRN